MGHKRKDTFIAPMQWWKHLRDWKKFQNSRERKAAKKRIRDEINS